MDWLAYVIGLIFLAVGTVGLAMWRRDSFVGRVLSVFCFGLGVALVVAAVLRVVI